jgi:hypothetical protein
VDNSNVTEDTAIRELTGIQCGMKKQDIQGRRTEEPEAHYSLLGLAEMLRCWWNEVPEESGRWTDFPRWSGTHQRQNGLALPPKGTQPQSILMAEYSIVEELTKLANGVRVRHCECVMAQVEYLPLHAFSMLAKDSEASTICSPQMAVAFATF